MGIRDRSDVWRLMIRYVNPLVLLCLYLPYCVAFSRSSGSWLWLPIAPGWMACILFAAPNNHTLTVVVAAIATVSLIVGLSRLASLNSNGFAGAIIIALLCSIPGAFLLWF